MIGCLLTIPHKKPPTNAHLNQIRVKFVQFIKEAFLLRIFKTTLPPALFFCFCITSLFSFVILLCLNQELQINYIRLKQKLSKYGLFSPLFIDLFYWGYLRWPTIEFETRFVFWIHESHLLLSWKTFQKQIEGYANKILTITDFIKLLL